MTEGAREFAAKHFQVLASLTQEQREALDREAMFKRAVQRHGRTIQHFREALFERLAAEGPAT